MMQGYVNTAYEAVISIVISHNGKLKSVNAVIDTGFTGFLSLPSGIIAELDLPWNYSDFATLGDGSKTLFDIH
jgi:predicted aspartyl protease